MSDLSLTASKPQFLRIAHRGGQPENTLLAMRQSLEHTYIDVIELDVQLSKDNHLVVIHDETVDRTSASNTGKVAEMTLQELQNLDFDQATRIPTLTEVLDLIHNKKIAMIECKSKGTATPLANTITDYLNNKNWKKDNFIVQSFYINEIKTLSKILPNIETLYLLNDIYPNFWNKILINTAKFLTKDHFKSVGVPLKFATKENVNWLHTMGKKVYVWTLDTHEEIQEALDAKADGVFSNETHLFLEEYH